MNELTLIVESAKAEELDGTEPLLERLGAGGEALANLARAGGRGEDELRAKSGASNAESDPGDEWRARVTLDGTTLWLRGDGDQWSIFARADDADAMLAARKLHGLIGEKSDGWDLDR